MNSLSLRVDDELKFLGEIFDLKNLDILELGCGNADFAKRILKEFAGSRITGIEADMLQHQKNTLTSTKNLDLLYSTTEDLSLPADKFNLAIMLKSLHHIPSEFMDEVLLKINRSLVSGGHIYLSEPVFDGTFNEIVRLFHDEQEVRRLAQLALDRASTSKNWMQVLDHQFMMPIYFKDFEDFKHRIIAVTYQNHQLDASLLELVKSRFETHMTPYGARFERPMHVRVLRKVN